VETHCCNIFVAHCAQRQVVSWRWDSFLKRELAEVIACHFWKRRAWHEQFWPRVCSLPMRCRTPRPCQVDLSCFFLLSGLTNLTYINPRLLQFPCPFTQRTRLTFTEISQSLTSLGIYSDIHIPLYPTSFLCQIDSD
jgi:hypothetical protein